MILDKVQIMHQAFANLMRTYPYCNLSKKSSWEIKPNMFLIKGKCDSIYLRPEERIKLTDSFLMDMDYQIYLITNCEIHFSFWDVINNLKVKH